MINFLLLLILSILVGYILFRLLKWSRLYKLWEKHVVEDQEDSMDQVNERKINNSQLPNIEVTSLQGEVYNVQTLIKERSLLIFLDHTCIFCNSNFEELFNLINETDKKYLLVFFKEEDLKHAKDFSELYSNTFDIFTVNQSLYASLNLTFLPAYVRLDQSFKIKHATPIPLQALNVK